MTTTDGVHWVENTCGGRVYAASMDEAIEATAGADVTPYVYSAAGRQPVVRYTLDGEEGVEVGDIGQSYDDLAAAVRDDLARYGDRAYM